MTIKELQKYYSIPSIRLVVIDSDPDALIEEYELDEDSKATLEEVFQTTTIGTFELWLADFSVDFIDSYIVESMEDIYYKCHDAQDCLRRNYYDIYD